MRTISGQIYAALGRSNRRVEDLAKTVGASRKTMYRRLASPGTLTINELMSICDALELHPTDLVRSLDPR